MASGGKVEVLCPNGHRVSVNVKPNTKLLQIVDECCLKQRLGQSNSFGLKLRHNQKPLDLSLSIQMAALSNMAKLDMYPITNPKATNRKPKVALQLDEVGRFQREFDPAISVSEVLESFQKDNGAGGQLDLSAFQTDNRQPVINYLNEEIVGDYALKSVTLKDLGVIDGGHLLRLSYKIISEERLQEIKEHIDKEKSRLSRLAAKANASGEVHGQAPDIPLASRPENIVSTQRTNAPLIDTDSAQVSEPMDTSVSRAQTAPVNNIGSRGEDSHSADTGSASESRATGASATSSFAQNYASAWDSVGSSHQPSTARPAFPFAEFKFPEETKGKDIYHNEFSDVKVKDFQPCDRESVLYCLDEVKTVEYEEMDDEFYEVTEKDACALQASLAREVSSLTEAQLMTDTMRRARREARYAHYRRVIIRFQLPDCHVLQALFRPKELVFALYKFVKENLADPNTQFELFTSPPKTMLTDKAKDLIEANLAPMTVVYVSTENYTTDRFLASNVLRNKSSQTDAKAILDKYMNLKPGSNSAKTKQSLQALDLPGSLSSAQPSGSSGSSNTSSSDKVPKWFKPGKK